MLLVWTRRVTRKGTVLIWAQEVEGGVFGGPHLLHRNNLHFTEDFEADTRYKAVTKGLQGLHFRAPLKR